MGGASDLVSLLLTGSGFTNYFGGYDNTDGSFLPGSDFGFEGYDYGYY